MPQITLHLDEATETLATQAAQAHGMSTSRWVAELIRRHANDTWPAGFIALAGAFPDFPLREEQTATGVAKAHPSARTN
ncbi:MAG: hypothetical protein GAK30_00695 [Paracidovorax wautersii]|uniref:Ribbon-helix-helix protein, copG family n=1 Tax=Paracidovorax wautersii TaxID=1177982 RepID=A0A7V8FRH0_9BURK|nr:MAG: hypothetical protein GAK30_00695 [Paracidovorax wautersii]